MDKETFEDMVRSENRESVTDDFVEAVCDLLFRKSANCTEETIIFSFDVLREYRPEVAKKIKEKYSLEI